MAKTGASPAGAVASGDLLVIAAAPSFAMGMTYVAMANSLSLAMGNATANQQRMQQIASAAVVQVLAMIVSKGAKKQ